MVHQPNVHMLLPAAQWFPMPPGSPRHLASLTFHLLQLGASSYIFRSTGGLPMTVQVLQFVELCDADRADAVRFAKLGNGDEIEVHIKRRDGDVETLSLPPKAAALIESILDHLSHGERLAVLTEDQELSPNDATSILGVSRPLVVHRMDVGDLPFRYVGKHRRATLRDVLALKTKIDRQRGAMEALAADAEDLKQRYGLLSLRSEQSR
jgi:hypothetical protein